MVQEIYPYLEYASLLIAFFFYRKYKGYTFYKFFVFYLITIVVFQILGETIFNENNYEFYNIYTFFEFNFIALIYYQLFEKKPSINILKFLWIAFNIVYFSSFYFLHLKKYTVNIEGIVNSLFVILYFIELLNSEKVINYKKLLPFWISVGFLLFYLTSFPFFLLSYIGVLIDAKQEFVILHSLIIVFHLCFIYGLITCKSKEI